MSKTLFDKVWDSHVVESINDGPDIFLIDKHFIHEVTSPQAFDELKRKNLKVFDPNKIIATVDHNVPTLNQHLPINDKLSRNQVEKLKFNCLENNIDLFGLGNPNQGIVHVIGPELGITQPGMTIVCGDSHTSTHGAFGAIAFGIGTSQVAQVLASQCLLLNKPKKMRISINGKLNKNVTPKDIILYIISKLGTNGGTGFFVEYSGDVFKKMSMEGRMTVCNMSIEMGARGGIIAPDEITYKYLKNRDYSPKGKKLNSKIESWNKLKTEKNAKFDKEHKFNASEIYPMLTYGTNPAMGIKYNDKIPDHNNKSDLKS
ncbi:MAG: aconitase family protein, partial [Bacteroidota bacterium]|nr:aconitase family protein [Bacteroidota bacterium]